MHLYKRDSTLPFGGALSLFEKHIAVQQGLEYIDAILSMEENRMDAVYERYKNLDLAGGYIGIEPGETEGGYFCTPEGAYVIGWEGCDGIHYCFLPQYDEMVFAVNPENEPYAYPVAENFADFLRMILACRYAGAVEQLVGQNWSPEMLCDFMNDPMNTVLPEQQEVLDALQEKLGLAPMEDPWAYAQNLKANFDPSRIRFTEEYYDVLGLDMPDGRSDGEQRWAPADICVYDAECEETM